MRSARLFISKHTRQNTLWDNDTTEITWDRNSSSEDYDVLAGHFPSSSTWTLAIFKYRVMAAFDRLRFLLQQCLFNYSGSVYLASSSGSLNPYETILINTLRLATSEWLTSLRVSFRPLSTLSGAVFAFLYKVGFEPTAYSLKGNRTTIVLLNLPVRATPIAPYAFGIQNTTRPIPFDSRSTQWCFATGVLVLLQSH